ncbi:H+transporting two-sector ATPase B/B' subunit [Methylocella silvestris BL2]|uniref:ATP synthase subunit b n=1 Tax=Methylocella silvestris (strain DSM 15510 / CIP 108128 / LMG 27833 / NCIMB 13906 / BL2) TaxID=395965 RepID=B8EMM3_METSB|nr:ATP synthase subunit B [Methylocella silvestris]ACK52702.1 H+transporting two-sector ATPase B/B' subunit [Methylocella silvestris BL2]
MATHEGHTSGTVEPADIDHGAHAFPPFDSSNFSSTLIWLAISFGLLYYLLSKIALPRVEGILNTRQGKITSDLEEAHRAREKSEQAAAEHEKTIASARAKAQALAQEAQAKINAENDAKRHALESNLAGKLADAEKQIVETKSKAMANVETIAAEAASAIVERLTGRPADGVAVAAAVSQSKA